MKEGQHGRTYQGNLLLIFGCVPWKNCQPTKQRSYMQPVPELRAITTSNCDERNKRARIAFPSISREEDPDNYFSLKGPASQFHGPARAGGVWIFRSKRGGKYGPLVTLLQIIKPSGTFPRSPKAEGTPEAVP